MNELIIIENSVKMSSLDIAEITGKRHADVMRDIRQEIENLGDINECIFALVDYVDAKGEKRPCFVFEKKGAMQLALKYDAKTRYKVICKIEELENKSKPKLPNFNNPAEAARAWAEQYEESERQKQINQENKPKVEFYDTVAESDSTIDMAAVAKTINQTGYGRNNLFKLLREQKILRNNNQPYQKYVNLGYFKQVIVPIKKKDKVWQGTKTVATAKGIDFILRIVKNDKAVIDAAIDEIMGY